MTNILIQRDIWASGVHLLGENYQFPNIIFFSNELQWTSKTDLCKILEIELKFNACIKDSILFCGGFIEETLHLFNLEEVI